MRKDEKKEKLRLWLEGQRKAQALIKAEQERRLPEMSREERLAAFNSLCELWRDRLTKRRRELDAIRIPELVRLRQRLRRASEAYLRERNS